MSLFRLVICIIVIFTIRTNNANAELFISELSTLDFGTLEIPTQGERHITIPADGGAYRGDGAVLSGITRRGQYRVTGDSENAAISLDITSTASPSGLRLSNFEAIYDDRRLEGLPAWGLVNPGPAGKILYLGATLTYQANMVEDSPAPLFDITVIYE